MFKEADFIFNRRIIFDSKIIVCHNLSVFQDHGLKKNITSRSLRVRK